MDTSKAEQITSTTERTLSEIEKEKLAKDIKLITPFKKYKLELESQKNWDLFYKRNATNFFKDRHWITREFPELLAKQERCVVLEVGCGCGNTVFPLLEENEHLFIYACDFSPRAVEFVKKNENYNETRCKAFQCDVTVDEISSNVEEAESVDIASLFFVMSAIMPDKMKHAIENVYKVLKPGGLFLFRDYGLYDHAMIRFAPGHKLDERLYVRQDGTRSYFFSSDETIELFESAGLETIECNYVFKRTVNIKEEKNVPRVFVQAKFRKPRNT